MTKKFRDARLLRSWHFIKHHKTIGWSRGIFQPSFSSKYMLVFRAVFFNFITATLNIHEQQFDKSFQKEVVLSEFEYFENTYMIQHVFFQNPQNSYHKHVLYIWYTGCIITSNQPQEVVSLFSRWRIPNFIPLHRYITWIILIASSTITCLLGRVWLPIDLGFSRSRVTWKQTWFQ